MNLLNRLGKHRLACHGQEKEPRRSSPRQVGWEEKRRWPDGETHASATVKDCQARGSGKVGQEAALAPPIPLKIGLAARFGCVLARAAGRPQVPTYMRPQSVLQSTPIVPHSTPNRAALSA